MSWTWPEEVETDTDYMHITMLWIRPEPHPPVPRPHPIVYTLLMRENNDAWQLIGQVSSCHVTWARVVGDCGLRVS